MAHTIYRSDRNGHQYDDDIIFERERGGRRQLEGVHRGRDERHEEELAIVDTRDKGRRFEAQPKPKERMWTEITKDLVSEEAIKEKGYEYEDSEECYYVMEYLRYVCHSPAAFLFSSVDV